MCGISGIWNRNLGKNDLVREITHMTDALFHRGPDNSDLWIDENIGLALGHRRLSVVDTSHTGGAQPMVSADGRYIITYNGEIYNCTKLRAHLPNFPFKGHSDTEVLLELCAQKGIKTAIEMCAGMFAFSLWDRQLQELWLVRDRFGIKPLYYGKSGGGFVFASELKAFGSLENFKPKVNVATISAFLQQGCVPNEMCIFEGMQKLPAGHLFKLTTSGKTEIVQWYDLEKATTDSGLFSGNLQDMEIALEALLEDVVEEHLLSDVPLGAFLSGGIDSSLIVSLMKKKGLGRVKTFSIGMTDKKHNESQYAKQVAAHLDTDHTEIMINHQDAIDIIPELPTIYDEPFADSSQIPTCLISKHTRKSVTVALSGDGGDEGFAGYTRYRGIATLWKCAGWMPVVARNAATKALKAISIDTWDSIAGVAFKGKRDRYIGDRIHKAANIISNDCLETMYMGLVHQWKDGEIILNAERNIKKRRTNDPYKRLMLLDIETYLTDDILTKVDRASMANSLEVRVPFLDHRVMEFALRLPSRFLLSGNMGKMPLRNILYKHVPKDLIDRPKKGFGIPIDTWLSRELRPWAEDLLSEKSLRETGFVSPTDVREKWREHLSGQRNWQYALWYVLMLQSWARRWSVSL